jgi:hypothetical protein
MTRDDVEKPVAFSPPREQRCSATEAEGLAVVEAVDHFRSVSHWKTLHHNIETDHKGFLQLMIQRLLVARWALRLQPFTYRVVHQAGSNANSLGG